MSEKIKVGDWVEWIDIDASLVGQMKMGAVFKVLGINDLGLIDIGLRFGSFSPSRFKKCPLPEQEKKCVNFLDESLKNGVIKYKEQKLKMTFMGKELSDSEHKLIEDAASRGEGTLFIKDGISKYLSAEEFFRKRDLIYPLFENKNPWLPASEMVEGVEYEGHLRDGFDYYRVITGEDGYKRMQIKSEYDQWKWIKRWETHQLYTEAKFRRIDK